MLPDTSIRDSRIWCVTRNSATKSNKGGDGTRFHRLHMMQYNFLSEYPLGRRLRTVGIPCTLNHDARGRSRFDTAAGDIKILN